MARFDSAYNETIEELLQAILSLRDMEECRAFLYDLCTIQELNSLSQRLQVAKRLMHGETYSAIRQDIPVSNATITRISTTLQFGSGGYRTVLARQQPEDSSGQ